MALQKSQLKDLPQNAVVLSELDALKYQMDLVKNWKKSSEVFALRYGPYFLGAAAFLSGAYLNNYFRMKFFLERYGRWSSYLPVSVVPSVGAIAFHSELVTKRIALMKFDECPVCLELRAAALQASIGVVFPTILAPVGSAALALRFRTYDVPAPSEGIKAVVGMFQKVSKKIRPTIFYMILGNAFLGSVVTYFEASNLINISQKFSAQLSSQNEFAND